jgi:multiple sugar transport system permease protein
MVGVRRALSSLWVAGPLLLVTLFPVLWTLLGSFKQLKDIVSPTPVLFFSPTLQNYAGVLATPSVRSGVLNSVIVVGASLGIGILLGVPAAHALARHVTRLKGDVLFYVLSLRFLPPVAVAIPFMALYLDLGIAGTRLSLVLTYCLATVSTIIWLGVSAFEQVPREIEEAARLEGCSDFGVFLRFSLPLAVPGLVGAVLFTFVIVWNELLVAAGFTTFGMEVPWGIINASTIVLALPPLLLVGLILRFLNRFIRSAE